MQVGLIEASSGKLQSGRNGLSPGPSSKEDPLVYG
jgi:hypothetical protein